MDEIIRKDMIGTIERFREHNAIKVITGIRRCGKSTLLRQLISKLHAEGVDDERIVYVNMESLSNSRFCDGWALYEHIMTKKGEGRLYIFLDEIQLVTGWERVVNSLKVDIDCDLYVTGSNAYLLSTEISTLLTGRCITFRLLPLSFREYTSMYEGARRESVFRKYLSQGGMPFIRSGHGTDEIAQRLREIESDIILKDICARGNADASKVCKLIGFLYSEIGNPISGDNISKATGISKSTVHAYLRLITDALLFNPVERYDLKGREILRSTPKYYCTDIGMRNTHPLDGDRDRGKVLENLVYLELVRRGYTVYTGKIGGREIDFVAKKDGGVDYYQVSLTVESRDTYEREMRPFRSLTSQGGRYLITGDPMPDTAGDDVTVMNIIDFLDDASNLYIAEEDPHP